MGDLARIDGDRLTWVVDTVVEARLAIKELKLLKKGYLLQKRVYAAKLRDTRSQHIQIARLATTPTLRGGGRFGRIVRTMQSMSRDARRAHLALSLAPVEQEKRQVERRITEIDALVLRFEVFIHEHS